MANDPTFLYDDTNVLFYGTETYGQAIGALQKVWDRSASQVETLLNAKYGAADFYTACEALKDAGVVQAKSTNGYNCFAYADTVTETFPNGPMYQFDSNQTSNVQVTARPVYDTVIDDVPTSPTYNKVKVNPVGNLLTPQHGFYGWKFFAGEALQALSGVATGISLGKTIDSALYNINPDFWDSIGMSSLDPTTWGQITNGDDSFAAGLFNMIFGIDPETGNAQAFIDENAYAYLAQWLNTYGIFQPESVMTDYDISSSGGVSYNFNNPIYIHDFKFTFPDPQYPGTGYIDTSLALWANTVGTDTSIVYLKSSNPNVTARGCVYMLNDDRMRIVLSTSTYPNNVLSFKQHYVNADTWDAWGTFGLNTFTNSNNQTSWSNINQGGPLSQSVNKLARSAQQTDSLDSDNALGNLILYNSYEEASSIDGIGTQDDAILPDTSTWNSVPNTLASLQQQYPDLWANAVPNTIVQPDGTTKTINYIPIPTPQAKSNFDTQPTSGDQTQTDTQVQPITNPTPDNNALLRTILEYITKTQTQPETQPDTENPTPTGTGTTDPPIPPTGVGSALWSVYNPSQAEINAFGGWLWSGDIITQIQQILQNPMEGIIALHKVFAQPVISGTGDIVVGRLSSGVSSNLVTNQYSYVDCGSVDLLEQFGNVFDYSPFTDVSLYLPFIGIVPLNTNDIMRSTINVKYGVDVFTGACLAMVTVTRDGNTVNMYQYSGVASVSYPLTGAQNSGLIGGLLSIAGGVASIATGNLVGGVLGAAGGLGSAAKSHMQRASAFSGNSGAMGIKIPYLIIERPQTKVASTFPQLNGYPTNTSIRLGDCSGQVVVKSVHVEGMGLATENELREIESLLYSGVLV